MSTRTGMSLTVWVLRVTLAPGENSGDWTDLRRRGFGDVTVAGRIKTGSAQVRFLSLPNAGVMLAEEGGCMLDFVHRGLRTFGAATKCERSSLVNKRNNSNSGPY
jgi:hypothetical protein